MPSYMGLTRLNICLIEIAISRTSKLMALAHARPWRPPDVHQPVRRTGQQMTPPKDPTVCLWGKQTGQQAEMCITSRIIARASCIFILGTAPIPR